MYIQLCRKSQNTLKVHNTKKLWKIKLYLTELLCKHGVNSRGGKQIKSKAIIARWKVCVSTRCHMHMQYSVLLHVLSLEISEEVPIGLMALMAAI